MIEKGRSDTAKGLKIWYREEKKNTKIMRKSKKAFMIIVTLILKLPILFIVQFAKVLRSAPIRLAVVFSALLCQPSQIIVQVGWENVFFGFYANERVLNGFGFQD